MSPTPKGLTVIIPEQLRLTEDGEDEGMVSVYPSMSQPGMTMVHVVTDMIDATAMADNRAIGIGEIADHLERIARKLRVMVKMGG